MVVLVVVAVVVVVVVVIVVVVVVVVVFVAVVVVVVVVVGVIVVVVVVVVVVGVGQGSNVHVLYCTYAPHCSPMKLIRCHGDIFMKWTVLQQKYPNKYLVKHVKSERTKKDNQRKPQIWAWVFQHAQTYVSNKGKELPLFFSRTSEQHP